MDKYLNKMFYKNLNKKIKDGLSSSGEFLEEEIKKKVGQTGGTSNSGEPPRKQTGDLQDSIQVDESKINIKKIKIGSDEEYSEMLEQGTFKMDPRPFLRPSYHENKKGILDSFIEGK